ncbi:acyloxyacyl hydrolase [Parabacteroides sp. PF5-9]|uniref:acyloxyacyl hydrolase n=1 Tax=Parabacteroides sp. PF5-9 TaxID=1742404 RepID=UPI002474A3D0|nr:acyloxyacyl hydrolase [Parabacteroides sp. PF5-9]MDH6357709.1 hypothetical protein [Parabacteroides sp. PF5-9]
MIKKMSSILLFLYACIALYASDSIPAGYSRFITATTAGGFVLPTKNITLGNKQITPLYSAFTLKYGWATPLYEREGYLFRESYRGIGIYLPRFSYQKELGNPFSIFLFQGGLLKDFNPKLYLHYEINLGASFNWNHYDIQNAPGLKAIGASTNVHLAGNWYFKWNISPKWDVHTGISFTHFSNGALRTPNNGLNTFAPFVELVYNLDKIEKRIPKDRSYNASSDFEKGQVHDFSVMFTTHTLKVDTAGTGLRSRYPHKRYNVVGMTYSYMLRQTRRFMWGPSVEMVYDESINASFIGEKNPQTGAYIEYEKLARPIDRFSFGVSLKGEITMPGYAIFANLGYDLYHKDKREKRLYQIYGVKVNLIENVFASFAVRSTNLTRSQYLYLSIGYRFQ